VANGNQDDRIDLSFALANWVARVFSLLLAAFFGFVGYMKAFALIAELASHGAWTVHLPQALGRAVGWSEIACAMVLLVCPFFVRCRNIWAIAAAILLVNQCAAALVHFTNDEAAALPQNVVLIAVCAFVSTVAIRSNSHRLDGETL